MPLARIKIAIAAACHPYRWHSAASTQADLPVSGGDADRHHGREAAG